ncbi:MAG: discoidin domain-containing protein, partial [Steroidobacteraceae bacterium]
MTLLLAAFVAPAQDATRTLDDFSNASKWRVITSDQVSGNIRQVQGVQGKALCLDYDFNGVSGYLGMQRDLPLDYPQNYRFDVWLRGDSPANDLQFKLLDASGDNVWWAYKPRYDFPREWTPVRYKRRHIGKAWGPVADPVLHKSAKLEYTVYNSVGGKGAVCFDQLTFTPLPVDDVAPPSANATASSASTDAGKAVDGDSATVWRSKGGKVQRLTLDFGRVREFGGLTLRWAGNDHASRYEVALSGDGKQWRTARTIVAGNGGKDWIALPESEARYIALSLQEGPGKSYALVDVVLEPLAFAAKPSDLIKSIASEVPRGRFSRGFSDEQTYWTILGIDGGNEQALIGEDGAVELGKGAPSIEPFVFSDGQWRSWADVQARQS